MAKQVTEKDTKAVILGALKEAHAEIDALKSKQLDPTAIVTEKQNKEVVAKATKTVGSSLDEIVATLQSTVNESLTALVSEFDTKKAEFANLEEAIKIKDAELQEIYGIERKAESLAALINSHDVLKKQQAEADAESLADFNEKLAAIKKAIVESQKNYEAQVKEQNAQLKQEHDRKRAEFNYDFAREQKIARDELADEVAQARKEIKEEQEEVDARIIDVELREERISELETQVNTIPELVEKAKATAYEQGKKDAEKSAVFERRAIESKKDADIQVLQHKVDLLQSSLDNEKASHEKTMNQLNEAYGRLEKVANSAVEGAKAQEVATKMFATIGEKTSK